MFRWAGCNISHRFFLSGLSLWSGPRDRLFRALVWFTAFAVALTLVRLACLASIEVPRNYNEGWNAYHALAAMNGGTLYPRAPSLFVNNYPPLSFFITGAVAKSIGDLIITGRLLSLLGTIVASGAIFVIARALGMVWIEALFATSLFLAKLMATSDYIGINDPQMLAHALGCLGFLVVVKAPPMQRSLALGALLLTVAVFVKHMLVVQPLVLFVWLAIYDRQNAIRLALFGLFFALLGLLLCRIATGTNLIEVLITSRSYKLEWMLQSLWDFLLVSFAPLGAGIFLLFSKDKRAVLCGIYTLAAFCIGLGFDGGAGVGRNALFDAAIAGAPERGPVGAFPAGTDALGRNVICVRLPCANGSCGVAKGRTIVADARTLAKTYECRSCYGAIRHRTHSPAAGTGALRKTFLMLLGRQSPTARCVQLD